MINGLEHDIQLLFSQFLGWLLLQVLFRNPTVRKAMRPAMAAMLPKRHAG